MRKEQKMKITVNGRVVYLGKSEPVYVDLREQSQGDSPTPVAYTTQENKSEGVLLDYDVYDEVLGVEIIAI